MANIDVKVGQRWEHNGNGFTYRVAEILNEGNSLNDDNNPPIIVYQRSEVPSDVSAQEATKRYGRYLTNWHKSFTFIRNGI